MTIEQRFGSRIRELRMMREISQEELAWRCQLSRNYVSDVERGKRNVSLKAIEKFAKGLDVRVEDLFHFKS
jgi:transcriptional regulator with XRE-family HTH domain